MTHMALYHVGGFAVLLTTQLSTNIDMAEAKDQ